MSNWNFYYSGILYGRLKAENGKVSCRELIPGSGIFTEEGSYSTDGLCQRLCSRNIGAFLENLPEYEKLVSAMPDLFSTNAGEKYQLRRNETYIQRQVKFPKDIMVKDGTITAIVMTGRDYTAVLVRNGMEQETIIKEWDGVYTDSPYPVMFEGTHMIETRDGVHLATDVYLPVKTESGAVSVPAVLIRTPYGKSKGKEQYYRFVQRGFAVVIQDTRGREDSGGEWLPNYYETEDGDDTLNWIAAQSWSDKQVSMTGGSYLGYVQWAAAASSNPYLKAMLSFVCAGGAFVDVPRRGGAFNSGMLAWAFAMTEKRMRGDLMIRDDWDEVLNIRPLKDIPLKALGHEVPFLSTWLKDCHKDYDDMWKRSSWKERSQGAVVPALIISGWFDDNGMGTTEALELVQKYPPETAKVILGPWMHSGNANYDLHHVYLGENALRYDIDLICFKWLEHFLNGVNNGIEHSAPVEYYTIGQNVWKEASSWPVPSAQAVDFYLDGSRQDIARLNKGVLTQNYPELAGTDSYDYDPHYPSTHIIDMSENELEVPENYTEEEKRNDILCYSTPALEQDLTITGDILVTLYVSSDCPDTDFMVRLTDVDEAGNSIKLADGIISAKYRNGFEYPEFMEPGKVYPVSIRTTKISNTFKKGHLLRFTITSSAKNFIFPNSNTKNGFDSEYSQTAHNIIHHGGKYASRITVLKEPAADNYPSAKI